jgi:glycosyltransferase involved in cell wall biosynthesis
LIIDSKNQPLLSVIIPTFNHANYIKSAIDSVLAQTYKNIEIVIVDNFSIDDTEAIIKNYDEDQISYHKYNNHGVIAASRNYGVIHAKGMILAFLDSDDVWEREKIDLQIPHLLSGKLACVATNYTAFGDTSLNYTQSKMDEVIEYHDYRYEDIVVKNPVINSSVIMMKHLFKKLNGFDENPELIAIEDWDLWLRASSNSQVRILTQKLVKYRVHPGNRRDKRDVHKRAIKLLEKQKKIGYLKDNIRKKALGHRLQLLGQACLNEGDFKGVFYYLKSLFFPSSIKSKIKSLGWVILFILPRTVSHKLVIRFGN